MIRDFWKSNWHNIILNLLLIGVFILFYGRFGDIMVDSFREGYIPAQILEGQVLYKNIFTIYAPFPYLFNALLFLIFGVNLKVLYTAGFLATAGIVNLVSKLVEKYSDKLCAFGIGLFIISAGALSPNVFNMIFPYSYGILYGLLFILFSIYFALRKNYFAAYLAYSLAICSKYEFLVFLPALLWFTSFKEWKKSICGLLIPISLCAIILFLQGVTFEDITVSFKIMEVIPSAETLKWFYAITGLTFSPKLLLIYGINLAKILIPFFLLHRFNKWWMKIIVFVYLYVTVSQEILVFAFPLILVMLCINFKKIDKEYKFIILSSLLISLKVFFAATMQSYGVFFLPFALISLLLLTPAEYKKSLSVLLIISAIIIGIENTHSLTNKNIKIETAKGVIYSSYANGKSVKDLVKYINQNTEKNDTVAIFPECLSANFLTERKTDNKFYSLIPLYVEIFGDDFIIARLEAKKPKYIAVSDYDTSNYRYKHFGKDYAKKIYGYIKENYNLEHKIEGGLTIEIYKLR